MASDRPPSALNWELLRRLRTGLPFRAEFYLAAISCKIIQTLAARANSQSEFIFLQVAVTIATLSGKLIVNKGPNLPQTWANIYAMFVAQPKAGKTNGHILMDKIRIRLYAITGMDNEIPTGTVAGVYRSTVECARRGGQPLHAPDEGITSVISLIEKKPGTDVTNFKPEVFFSSGWSGANVGRAKAAGPNLATGEARLTLLAMGTLADIMEFHRICLQQYANRGLLGRFLTAFAPVYSAPCELPIPENEEEESLLAFTTAELSTLLLEAFVALYRQVEAPDFDGFRFCDEAIQHLADLRAQEAADQGGQEEEQHWSEVLTNHLLSHVQREFRATEMIEKWSLILHTMEQCFNSMNFMERTITNHELDRVITMVSVERAEALVRRAQEQDGFFIQVLRIATPVKSTFDVIENVDFVLYKCLRQLIMMWPGAVVTSESFSDRCSRLNVPINYNDICDAAEALGEMGSLTREEGATRITRPGSFSQRKTPRREFRFYKTHPDLLADKVLEELALDLKEYTRRYFMDYYQVVDAMALRSRRSEKKFDSWIQDIPRTLQPKEENFEATTTGRAGTSGGGTPFPLYGKYAKYQHEDVSLRFGPALSTAGSLKRRRLSGTPTEQHVYRVPGCAPISNLLPNLLESADD